MPCTPTAVENASNSTSIRNVSSERTLLNEIKAIYRARNMRPPLKFNDAQQGNMITGTAKFNSGQYQCSDVLLLKVMNLFQAFSV
jgi:hypothetical protein